MLNKRLAFVDSLRGIAALYVFVVHIVLLQNPVLPLPKFLAPFILNGTTGVTLFFIISGFTLCYAFDARVHERNHLSSFYIRRAARILPLYFALLIFFGISIWGIKGLLYHFKDILIYGSLLFTFIPGHQEGLLPASWTLSIEVVFYAIFPFLFRLSHSLKRSLAFLAFALVISVIYTYTYHNFVDIGRFNAYFTIFYQLPIFVMGMVVYFIYKKTRNIVSTNVGYIFTILAVAGIIFLPYRQFDLFFPVYVIACFYSLLFVGLSLTPINIFVNRVTGFLGMISYSVYLIHSLVIFRLKPYYHKLDSITDNDVFIFILYCLITLLPVILISFVTYKIIEEKYNKAGRSIINYLQKIKISS